MSKSTQTDIFPEVLDRLVEVLRHFHCEEPRELENLLRMPEDTLAQLFRRRLGALPGEVVDCLESAGVRREFLLHGRGSMLSDALDGRRLLVLERHAAHLLKVIYTARRALSGSGGLNRPPAQVTDGRSDPLATEEELINLLIEALSDRTSRDRLLAFIRAEASNRAELRPGDIL